MELPVRSRTGASHRSQRRDIGARVLLGRAAGCVLALLGLLAVVAAAPVLAHVTTVKIEEGSSSPTITVGLQPRSTALLDGSKGTVSTIKSFDNPEGHPVMHSSVTYAIYWDPSHNYNGDWQHLVDTFLQLSGSESSSLHDIYAVNEQYTDKTNARAAYRTTFRGAYTDTKPYPASGCIDPDLANGEKHLNAVFDNLACLTDKQLQTELQAFVSSNGLTPGMGTIFYLLTPPGVTVCLDEGKSSGHCSDFTWEPKPKSTEEQPNSESYKNSFCSYHSAISPTNPTEGDANTILYANIPWTAGGIGDYHLMEQAPAYDCQDGGWDASAKSLRLREEEKVPPEAAHQQEPNQLAVGTRGPDGTFDTGLTDLIINQVATEQQDTVTNPLLNAWHDEAGNEAVDECRDFFSVVAGGEVKTQENTQAGTLYNQVIATNHYYLNDAFNLAANKQGYPGVACLPGVALEPQFTAPNPVNAGDIVGFDASESNITLDAGQNYPTKGVPFITYPTYTWDFGDGTKTVSSYPPGASPVDEPSVFHSYQYGGTYDVTVTVTDIGGNTTSYSRPITVDGPPPPSSTPGESRTSSTTTAAPAGSSAGTTGSSTSGSTPSTSTAAGVPAPTVYDYILSGSLKKVLRYGLAIRYSVNEQVAGAVEVMLNRRMAKRLHIRGAAARGLPAGYPSSIVLGGAVLVTTQAGQGTLRLKFLKPLPERLAHVHRLTLTLRIVVRNADRLHPKTATLLSTVVLKG